MLANFLLLVFVPLSCQVQKFLLEIDTENLFFEAQIQKVYEGTSITRPNSFTSLHHQLEFVYDEQLLTLIKLTCKTDTKYPPLALHIKVTQRAEEWRLEEFSAIQNNDFFTKFNLSEQTPLAMDVGNNYRCLFAIQKNYASLNIFESTRPKHGKKYRIFSGGWTWALVPAWNGSHITPDIDSADVYSSNHLWTALFTDGQLQLQGSVLDGTMVGFLENGYFDLITTPDGRYIFRLNSSGKILQISEYNFISFVPDLEDYISNTKWQFIEYDTGIEV